MERRLLGRTAALAMVLTAAAAVGGCAHRAKDRPGPSATRPSASARAGGSSANSFEQSRDPPIAPDTRFAAGQVAETRGALEQAAEQYRQALKDNPKHLDAMYRLGVVYAQLKRYPQAIETWKQYVKATNESASAYANLGFCCELMGRGDDAEAAYQKGIKRDPRNGPCRVNYGLMLVRGGRVSEGRTHLQAVLSEAEVHYNIASVYETLGRKEQAKLEYRAALEADPNLTDAKARLEALDGQTRLSKTE